MKTVLKTSGFDQWLAGLDPVTEAKLAARLKKVERGLMGDCEPVGEGVFELREHFGAGWRMYFIEREKVYVVMLGGGTKRTQTRDIKAAKKAAKEIE